jgi:4-nitrophenyl phosphatase
MALKAILLDADGVLWRGREVIPEAPGFIRRAQAAGLRCLLVSNNAGPNREAYSDKCRRLDLELAPEDIYSVNHLAGPFVAEHYPGRRVLVIGSTMLVGAMAEHADVTDAGAWLAGRGVERRLATPDDLRLLDQADFEVVLIGIDVAVSYLKLCLACVLVQRGALLIGANPDYSFPFEGGVVLPGNGSIVSLVAAVSGVEPLYLGKPSLHLFEQIRSETGFAAEDLIMVGDRPETDYEFAKAAGIFCYMVKTGVTAAEQMPADGANVKVLPTLDEVAQDLGI